MGDAAWWLAQVAMPAAISLSSVAILSTACVAMVTNVVTPTDAWRIAGAGIATGCLGIAWGWLVNHGARTLMLAR